MTPVLFQCGRVCVQHLKYHTQIHVKSRHGKNKGRKISGVEPLPGEDKVRGGRWECLSL